MNKKYSCKISKLYNTLALAEQSLYIIKVLDTYKYALISLSNQYFLVIFLNQQSFCSCHHKLCVHTLYLYTKQYSPLISFKINIRQLIKKGQSFHQDLIIKSLNLKQKKIKFKQFISPDKNNLCIICFEEIEAKDNFQLNCIHFYHLNCIKVWFDYNDKKVCPICRQQIILDQYNEIQQRFNEMEKLQYTHSNLKCSQCLKSPIVGKVFVCLLCDTVNLCQTCFEEWSHLKHCKFVMKFRKKDSWLIVPQHRFNLNQLSMKLQQQKETYLVSCFERITIVKGKLKCCECAQRIDINCYKLQCSHFIHLNCLLEKMKEQSFFCSYCNKPFLRGYRRIFNILSSSHELRSTQLVRKEHKKKQIVKINHQLEIQSPLDEDFREIVQNGFRVDKNFKKRKN